MAAVGEKLGNHQSYHISSSAEHECLYQISLQYI